MFPTDDKEALDSESEINPTLRTSLFTFLSLGQLILWNCAFQHGIPNWILPQLGSFDTIGL